MCRIFAVTVNGYDDEELSRIVAGYRIRDRCDIVSQAKRTIYAPGAEHSYRSVLCRRVLLSQYRIENHSGRYSLCYMVGSRYRVDNADRFVRVQTKTRSSGRDRTFAYNCGRSRYQSVFAYRRPLMPGRYAFVCSAEEAELRSAIRFVRCMELICAEFIGRFYGIFRFLFLSLTSSWMLRCGKMQINLLLLSAYSYLCMNIGWGV